MRVLLITSLLPLLSLVDHASSRHVDKSSVTLNQRDLRSRSLANVKSHNLQLLERQVRDYLGTLEKSDLRSLDKVKGYRLMSEARRLTNTISTVNSQGQRLIEKVKAENPRFDRSIKGLLSELRSTDLGRLKGIINKNKRGWMDVSLDLDAIRKIFHKLLETIENALEEMKALQPGLPTTASTSTPVTEGTTYEPSIECATYETLCLDGKQCIWEYYMCDGEPDCDDGSDESENQCGLPTTASTLTPITEGTTHGLPTTASTLTPITEEHECPSWQFKCPNSSKCISTFWKCDGWEDCDDGSDEANCDGLSTTASRSTPVTEVSTHGLSTTASTSTQVTEVSTHAPTGPPDTNCGRLPLMDIHGMTKRIVGGQETTAHNWPSICSLWKKGCTDHCHNCGGTLVKNKQGKFYIITAAHCLEGYDESSYEIRCGVHDLTGDTLSHMQTFNVVSIEVHEKFDYHNSYDHDIAVLTLEHQPKENDFVQAACLASTEHEAGESAVAVGWGRLEYMGAVPDVLQELYTPIVDDESCRKNISSISLGSDIDIGRMVCAGHVKAGKGICHGDSGGPLYTQRDGRWTLTGVSSFVKPCAVEGFVDVYADIYSLRDWIDTKINS